MRKHKLVTIEAEGRDRGKSFLIVEKSAFEAEKWAARALMALSRAGAEVPDEMASAGVAGILAVGFEAFKRLAFADADPLMEEMLDCISTVPDPSRIDPATGRPFARRMLMGDAVNDADVEEVGTLVRLRAEVLEIHLGFSLAAMLSSLAAARRTSSQPDTPTSPKAARSPSPRAKRRSTSSKPSTD